MSSHDLSSDEEVFVGELSLKEIKKRFSHIATRQTIACVEEECKGAQMDESLKLIETHSEPDMTCKPDGMSLSTEPYIEEIEECQMANLKEVVSKLSIPDQQPNLVNPIITLKEPHELEGSEILEDVKESFCNVNNITPTKIVAEHFNETQTPKTPFHTPLKSKPNTPRSVIKASVFKTPLCPRSHKKDMEKRTPLKNNFTHIESPVASYIKNGPLAPLVQGVKPKKPLQTTSAIPKLLKSTKKPLMSNKENTKLPSLAYRSAKETKLIDVPNEKRMPESGWAKKVISSLPKPMVIKHGHREVNIKKKMVVSQQEDSFADLSLHQADMSVCTQKSAFNTLKD